MGLKFTLLKISLALLLGSSVVWGQQGRGALLPEYQKQVTPRRTDATPGSRPAFINGASNVGAIQFGAGESATVDNQMIFLPLTGGNGNSANALNIGSTISKNIVINNYNAGGKASGFLNIMASGPVHYNAGNIQVDRNGFYDQTPIPPYNAPASRPTGVQPGLYDPAAIIINPYNVDFSPWYTNLHQLAGPMWCHVDLYQQSAPSYIDYIAHLYLSNHIPLQLHHWGVKATEKGGLPYTTTRGWLEPDSIDDGTNLVASVGQEGISINAVIGNANIPDDKYIRPTTLAVDGANQFQYISFYPLEWYLQAHNLETFPPNSNNWYTETIYSLQSQLVGTCSHVGNLSLRLYQIGDWVIDTIAGPNKLDAAIQLIDGARVCVYTDITDSTGYIGSSKTNDAANNAETNALIVFPVDDRVTLRTKGNYQANMHHERDSLTTTNILYSADDFPDPDANIYLYPATNSSNHPYNTPYLSAFNHPMVRTSVTQPATDAAATIFGVYGNYLYTGNMPDIYTTATHSASAPFAPVGQDNNPGVIEVGPQTAGKTHYHVYSGGILKNFENCNPGGNFIMHFGQRYGGTPNFYLDQDNDLSILNYGNYGTNSCPADIYFHYSSADTIADAFTAATGSGAFRVQALSDVEMRADVAINATTFGNNIYLLSDGGNVVTQKFDIASDYASTIGQGLLTLWAEDRTPAGSDFSGCPNDFLTNRNSERGNIFLNEAVAIMRAGTVAGTETNLIAANNIRTAGVGLTSTSTVNDSVNIISRKGDIYLGYSLDAQIYNTNDAAVSNNLLDYDDNTFTYDIQNTANAGVLNIKAGFDETDNGNRYEGGNIYFTSIQATMPAGGSYPANIMIPFSNEFTCAANNDSALHRRAGASMQHYEHSGIIGGVGRKGIDGDWTNYAGKLDNATTEPAAPAGNLSIDYKANKGDLTVDAGTRGNIIMNTGASLDFQDDAGNGFFRTRYGDIDMRGETDATNLNGSLLFLASSDQANKWITGICGCTEQRNNVYLQDFQYTNTGGTNGSVFVGADNNIKLNYGGLTNQATQADPFLSKDFDPRFNWGTPYKGNYHCDLNPSVNQARDLILDFNGVNGGFAAVAADRINVYKKLIYTGGTGTGMSTVPGQGTLQGETVAGYGLLMKTTAAKDSWNFNGLDGQTPQCPFSCEADNCTQAALHNIVRMTFHDDVRIFPNNQKVLLASPVIESFGHIELDVINGAGSKTAITIKADSLIFHDSMILNETTTNKVKFETWTSALKTPIMKFGYKRNSPPVQEIIYTENGTPFRCNDCVTHTKGDPNSKIDTMVVVFKNDASLERSASTIVDHTVITFLTDSFDHTKDGLIRNAKIYTDLFKVRNQVEFWRDEARTRDGHFELISEEQMFSKDYAGVYTRHLHMEPVGACGRPYSDLWLCDPALDVITSSTFGGYGKIHADVHVEIEGRLAPGYASLGLLGNCYEQKAGTLSMENLRLDKGAEIHYTIGNVLGLDDEYSDCIDADEITMYGDVYIHVEKRPCQNYVPGCYPIIRYNTVAIGGSNLNNLKLATKEIDGLPLSLNTATPGVVYLCVGENIIPSILRKIHIPQTSGVTMISPPQYGDHYIFSYGHFYFTVKYDSEIPLKVTTSRIIDGVTEELIGTRNVNGEYEYVIHRVQENIILQFGPEYATGNTHIADKKAIWAHGNTIYIHVEKEDIASIYSIAGQLVKQVELPEGNTSIPMTRGIYIVTLKDGSVHKVILK